MIYFSDKELDDFLLEDIYRGDLTTHALGLDDIPARMQFKRKDTGIVAGIAIAEKLLRKLDVQVRVHAADGENVAAGTLLLSADGRAEQLHQAWKVVQLVLEWSCGVAQYTAEMIANAKAINPQAVVACTRKSIPNTRKLATHAVLAAGGHIHRQGLSETLLVFTNHCNLLDNPTDYQEIVSRLKREAPENKITLEADNFSQFEQMLAAEPDIIQLDKWSPEQVQQALALLKKQSKKTLLSVAGGVNKNNIADYAKLGINLFITSAPYYAPPEDIKVVIERMQNKNT
ncbi:ModD protein [Aggregatibacter actinomycetemcomitans]|uniref:ModD protein n=1 Tax=Aggregatibacter actinomycetemcomitans TaxID=714 RepID=UPI0011D4E466|nr:ModD protein [Aggregatibacter actinomycetemcomitans]QEH45954.1 ModD protein [Aggregatibacter actinomycetemcomitans]QEH50037.1 ModD protein [Aggregatibacter actinomycetemcomitans]TYB29555.1 ModD protein [Aggregatibacter actinomycetemcomitans]